MNDMVFKKKLPLIVQFRNMLVIPWRKFRVLPTLLATDRDPGTMLKACLIR